MANSKSAMKRIRQNAKKREQNRVVRQSMRTACKAFETAADEGDKTAAEAKYLSAISALDRAASKGVIPAKRADRKKGRLAVRLNAVGA